MALSEDMDAYLLKLPWKSLQIGNCSFFGKVCFTDAGYCLLLSDLSSMWCEEAASDVIQERSKELNKRLKAPVSSFLTHLSKLILPLLDSTESDPDRFSYHRTEGTLMLHVKSQLSGLPFYWDFHCKEASISMACRHLLRPLLSMTKALEHQCQQLGALLGRKDAEIQDYQDSGAVLTRSRLRTDPYDEESFQQTFLAENIQDLCSSGNVPRFSDQLQQLYGAVIKAGGGSEQAKPLHKPRSVDENSGCVEVKEASSAQEDGDNGQGQKLTQVPAVADLTLTQCPPVTVSKAKKRKAKGLFT
ncbi:non-homologous end-joining factor 1 [Pseudophryne corroboree]|uniref:non-homologous end-joining factor 1 n=1 Tax=Pseudophryne corroboree TaxID=495146 RepID=UPI0030814651